MIVSGVLKTSDCVCTVLVYEECWLCGCGTVCGTLSRLKRLAKLRALVPFAHFYRPLATWRNGANGTSARNFANGTTVTLAHASRPKELHCAL